MEIFLPTLFTAPPQPHQQLGSRPFQSVHVGATAAIGLPWTPSHSMNCNPLPSSPAVIIHKAGYLHRWLGHDRQIAEYAFLGMTSSPLPEWNRIASHVVSRRDYVHLASAMLARPGYELIKVVGAERFIVPDLLSS
jgi:hypothetical protein